MIGEGGGGEGDGGGGEGEGGGGEGDGGGGLGEGGGGDGEGGGGEGVGGGGWAMAAAGWVKVAAGRARVAVGSPKAAEGWATAAAGKGRAASARARASAGSARAAVARVRAAAAMARAGVGWPAEGRLRYNRPQRRRRTRMPKGIPRMKLRSGTSPPPRRIHHPAEAKVERPCRRRGPGSQSRSSIDRSRECAGERARTPRPAQSFLSARCPALCTETPRSTPSPRRRAST